MKFWSDGGKISTRYVVLFGYLNRIFVKDDFCANPKSILGIPFEFYYEIIIYLRSVFQNKCGFIYVIGNDIEISVVIKIHINSTITEGWLRISPCISHIFKLVVSKKL